MPPSHGHLLGVARTPETKSQRALWLSSPGLKIQVLLLFSFLLRCTILSLVMPKWQGLIPLHPQHSLDVQLYLQFQWEGTSLSTALRCRERRKSFSFSAILPSNLQQISCCQESGRGFGGWCGEVGTVWGTLSMGWCCWMQTTAEPLDGEEEPVP